MLTNSEIYKACEFVISKHFEINSIEITLVTFRFNMHVGVNLQTSNIYGLKSTISTFECIFRLQSILLISLKIIVADVLLPEMVESC